MRKGVILFLLPLISVVRVFAFQGRYAPFFPNFNSKYMVKGIIVDNNLYYHSSKLDLYSPKVKILNEYNIEVGDTAIFVPDTIGMTVYSDFNEIGWYLKNNEEYYISFSINKLGQLCYQRFLEVQDGRVIENMTRWQEFLIRRFRISPRGMSVERFEKRLKKKLPYNQTKLNKYEADSISPVIINNNNI